MFELEKQQVYIFSYHITAIIKKTEKKGKVKQCGKKQTRRRPLHKNKKKIGNLWGVGWLSIIFLAYLDVEVVFIVMKLGSQTGVEHTS